MVTCFCESLKDVHVGLSHSTAAPRGSWGLDGPRFFQHTPGAYMGGMLQGYVGILLETSVYCWSWETNSWHLNFNPFASQGLLNYPSWGIKHWLAMQIYGKFEGLPLHSALFRLVSFYGPETASFITSELISHRFVCWRATTSASLLNAAMV